MAPKVDRAPYAEELAKLTVEETVLIFAAAEADDVGLAWPASTLSRSLLEARPGLRSVLNDSLVSQPVDCAVHAIYTVFTGTDDPEKGAETELGTFKRGRPKFKGDQQQLHKHRVDFEKFEEVWGRERPAAKKVRTMGTCPACRSNHAQL
jgi:hypothetical protein